MVIFNLFLELFQVKWLESGLIMVRESMYTKRESWFRLTIALENSKVELITGCDKKTFSKVELVLNSKRLLEVSSNLTKTVSV